MEYAYENSPFYRRLYSAAGMEPGDIKTFEDIAKVPKTDKGMLRKVQENPPFPYGDILTVPLDEVTEFRQTSGTTGTPVYQADTWQDWEWWSECWSYILYSQGYRTSDRVFLPFGYNIFVAFWAGHYALEKVGCEVVPGGVLDTEARILKMQELKCTAFMATPTYVLGMADTARKMGIDPTRDLSIQRITCAGEPAPVSGAKKRIEEAEREGLRPCRSHGDRGMELEVCSRGLHVNDYCRDQGRRDGRDHGDPGEEWQDGHHRL